MAGSATASVVVPEFKSWQDKAKSARDYRDATLSKVEPPLGPLPDPLPLSSQDLPKQLLTEREYELTQNYDAIVLLEMLRSKKVTSEELTRAFLRRAALAQYAVRSPASFLCRLDRTTG